MKTWLRKIVHLCGGIMPDEIVPEKPPSIKKLTSPINCLHVSFKHESNATAEYIDNCAARLLGQCIIDNGLTECETNVDFPTGMVTRNYSVYAADPHLNI